MKEGPIDTLAHLLFGRVLDGVAGDVVGDLAFFERGVLLVAGLIDLFDSMFGFLT